MAARTFKIQAPPMEGADVKGWQETLNKQLNTWDVDFRLSLDGVYGQVTRSMTASILYGLGIAQDEMEDGVTSKLRIKVRNKRLSDEERKRYDKRENWRKRFKKRHEDGGHVSPPLARIISSEWGWHPPGHDGVDLICRPNAPIFALCDGKVIDVRTGGWWGKAPSGDVSKGDGIIQIECQTDVGPFKKGMHFGYGHAEHPTVKVGQSVKAGDQIGRAGLAVAWHIHFMANGGGTNRGVGDRNPMPFVNYAMRHNR